jgi:nucleotide-binding universal stress UspA family protein
MFKHILVPLDGSHRAEAALPVACELASKFDGEITLLQVTPPPFFLSHADGRAYADLLVTMRQENRAEAQAYLNAHKGSLRQQGYIVHTVVLEDESPANAILGVVEGQNMDVVVMSTHGRSGVARWVYGSVAGNVLHHSHVPVLLIRARKEMLPADMLGIESEANVHSHELA